MTRHDTALYDTIRYGTLRYDTTRCDTIRYDTTRLGTIRPSSRSGQQPVVGLLTTPVPVTVSDQRNLYKTVGSERYTGAAVLRLLWHSCCLHVAWLLDVHETCISRSDLLNLACCLKEIEVADQTSYLIQSHHTDTGPTRRNTDPIKPGV